MTAMQDLNDLRFFVDVVDAGGFAAAARKLGMPRSRLSRRIGLLEERLGVRLIQRYPAGEQAVELPAATQLASVRPAQVAGSQSK